MTASVMSSRGDNAVTRAALTMCKQLLTKVPRKRKILYPMPSVGVASVMWQTYGTQPEVAIRRCQHWRYNRVPWYRARNVFPREGDTLRHSLTAAWSPNACTYHLTNVTISNFKNTSRQELLEGKSFLSFLFQKSLGHSPAIMGRSRACLRRLPDNVPLTGAEIGVMRGANAANLLYKRKRLSLHCIDRWNAAEDADYAATGDWQATLTDKRWQRIFQDATRLLQFADDRAHLIRQESTAALQHVPDASLDFVFDDANHSYRGVRSDLAWASKVKPGGWIGGHDYGHAKEGVQYGVKRAVDEWAKERGLAIETDEDFTWFCKIPKS